MSILEIADHFARVSFVVALAGVGVDHLAIQVGGWSKVLGWVGGAFRSRL